MAVSKTQQQVLEVLRAIKAAAPARIAKDEQTAYEPFSDNWKAQYTGVYPDGAYVGNHWAGVWARIPGVSYRTYEALVKAGLVRHNGHGFEAI